MRRRVLAFLAFLLFLLFLAFLLPLFFEFVATLNGDEDPVPVLDPETVISFATD